MADADAHSAPDDAALMMMMMTCVRMYVGAPQERDEKILFPPRSQVGIYEYSVVT